MLGDHSATRVATAAGERIEVELGDVGHVQRGELGASTTAAAGRYLTSTATP